MLSSYLVNTCSAKREKGVFYLEQKSNHRDSGSQPRSCERSRISLLGNDEIFRCLRLGVEFREGEGIAMDEIKEMSLEERTARKGGSAKGSQEARDDLGGRRT